MRVLLTVVIALVALWILVPIVKMLVGFTLGLIHLAILLVVLVFVVGLIQRLMRRV